jgi:CTP:phosphocholine cytidylyltransferase-like protein
MPKPESKHYLDAIKKGLTKKLELYKRKNDTERIYAATSVLEDLNKLK